MVSAAAALAVPTSASAADSYPCRGQARVSWSAKFVQLCPLTSPESNGNVPLFANPTARPAGAGIAPRGWLHGTANQRFVCQSRFPNAVYHHAAGWRNNWWAYTLSDDNVWGWVPEAYFRGGLNDERDAGLVDCPAGGPVPGGPQPAAPPDLGGGAPPSATGGPISRQEVLNRSLSWVQRRVMYSQRRFFEGYRRDCSGFVSMAWHLKSSPNSAALPAYGYRIAKSRLLPGDMFRKPGHVALFIGWAGPNRPIVREEYLYGKPATERVWSASWTARYTAYRYRNIR